MDMAAMFARIAGAVGEMTGGPYVSARIIDQSEQEFDNGGSIVDAGVAVTRSCMCQIDAATEAMRQADGYAEGDCSFLILSASLSGPLDTDATVEVLAGPSAGLWLVSALQRDPFGICWQGRGRRA